MSKFLTLILCLSIISAPVLAQKHDTKHGKPSAAQRRDDAAAEREFGAAARAYEKKERAEKTRRNEATNSKQATSVPKPDPLPVFNSDFAQSAPKPSLRLVTKQELAIEVRRARNLPAKPEAPTPRASSKRSVSKIPDTYKLIPNDTKNRAVNPLKAKEREEFCRRNGCANPKLPTINTLRFPVAEKHNGHLRGPIVKDALGQTIGRMALTTVRVVLGTKQRVRQQIAINKNEGQEIKVRGRLKKYEMGVGIQLTNGAFVSGLVPRAGIPVKERPKPSPTRRAPPITEQITEIPITGGNAFSAPPGLFGLDANSRRVPLKFRAPNTSPPRGYNGKHREANDYLPRPIDTNGPLDTTYYISLLGNKLPGGGGGGIATTVIKIDRNDPNPPIFEAYTNRSPKVRRLYLPNSTIQRGRLLLVPGRLKGAENLGTIYIAAPNLLFLPRSTKRR